MFWVVIGGCGDSSSRDRLLKAMWVQKFERKGCDPPLQAEGEFNTDPRVKYSDPGGDCYWERFSHQFFLAHLQNPGIIQDESIILLNPF